MLNGYVFPSMFTLMSCSYALLFHHVILLWLSSSPFKLNLTLIEPEQICWLSHGATESSSLVQPHLPGWEGPNSVYCHASHRYLQPRKVMSACYPDQVGGYNLVYPVLVLSSGPRLGQFCLATTVAGVRSDTGVTHDIAQRGICQSGRESVLQ